MRNITGIPASTAPRARSPDSRGTVLVAQRSEIWPIIEGVRNDVGQR